MSYEYFAPLDASLKFPLVELMERSNLRSILTVLTATESELQLTWRDQLTRTEWPEDVSVIRDAKGIFVQFHTGSRDAYSAVLSQISTAVASLACYPITFQEDI